MIIKMLPHSEEFHCTGWLFFFLLLIVRLIMISEFKGVVSRIVSLTNANLDQISVAHSTWGQQFSDAMNVNGGDIEGATKVDYLMHFFTFGWKVCASFILTYGLTENKEKVIKYFVSIYFNIIYIIIYIMYYKNFIM